MNNFVTFVCFEKVIFLITIMFPVEIVRQADVTQRSQAVLRYFSHEDAHIFNKHIDYFI